MKTWALFLLTCIAFPAYCQIGGGTCSISTLSGTYSYLLSGSLIAGGQTLPYAELGTLVADGRGTASGQSVASSNGTLSNASLSGTYSVQPDCVARASLIVNSQSETLAFQIVNGGNAANIVLSTLNGVITGRALRQSAAPAGSIACGNGSLSGRYGYLLTGVVRLSATNSLLYADDGQVASDGNGNLTVASAANTGGSVATTPGTGTYTVAADCTATAHVTNQNGTINYRLAIAEDGNSILFIGVDAGYTIAGYGQPQFAAPQQAIVNSASYSPRALSPGSLFSIFGATLSQQVGTAQTLPVPSTLASTQVLVNEEPVPLFYVGPGQINAQMPLELPAGKPATIAVKSSGAIGNRVTVNVAASGPGVFIYGANRAVVQNPDGSLNGDSSPARPGDILVAYLTGGGPVNAAGILQTGAASPFGLSPVTSDYTATVGGKPATVAYLGLTPTLVGVYQMNFTVPSLEPGQYAVSVSMNGSVSNGPTITVAK